MGQETRIKKDEDGDGDFGKKGDKSIVFGVDHRFNVFSSFYLSSVSIIIK